MLKANIFNCELCRSSNVEIETALGFGTEQNKVKIAKINKQEQGENDSSELEIKEEESEMNCQNHGMCHLDEL